MMTLLAIDIGGSAVKYGFYTENKLTHTKEFPTPLTRASFYQEIQQIISSYQGDEALTGIGLSCPGEVDETTGQINGLSFVPFLHLGEFQTEFSTTVGLPVTMINDANSAALAEMTLGVGQGHQQALFVIIGTGIGLGVVKNGHVILESKETKEELPQYLAGSIKDMKNTRVSPVHISRRVSLKKFHLPQTYNGKDVFKLAAEGDKVAVKEIERMYQSLADVVISLEIAFEPEIIAIGGGISNNPELLPRLQKTITEKLADETYLLNLLTNVVQEIDTPITPPNLVLCKYRNEANLLGAVIHYQKQAADGHV